MIQEFMGRSPLEGVDPKGRFDVLASALLVKVSERDPQLQAIIFATKPVIDQVLHSMLGPRTKSRRRLAESRKTKPRARRVKTKPRARRVGKVYIPEVMSW